MLWADVIKGKDPQAEKIAARRAGTFGELADDYFAALERDGTLRSTNQYRGHFDRYLRPRLGSRKVDALTTGDFVEVKNALLNAGKKGTAGPVIAVAASILSWAINERLVNLAVNPAHGVKLPKLKSTGRALSHDEIKALWGALPEIDCSTTAAVLKIMLFTGARSGEVLAMRWQDIGKDDYWTQPTNKTDRVHRVYLVKTVRDVLAGLGAQAEELVFPAARGGGRKGLPIEALTRLRDMAGVADFKPHMLRHTAETEMQRLRVPPEVRRRMLNHAEGGMGAVYGHHDFDAERKATALRLERHLLAVATGKASDKVVALRG
jgi:integrase